MSHGIIVCEGCGTVLTSCRCMGPHDRIPRGYCQACGGMNKESTPQGAQGGEPGPARRAPVQGQTYKGEKIPPGTISWAEHLEVWEGYHRQHPDQSAEKIAERGGFGYGEIEIYGGKPPRTWVKRGDPIPSEGAGSMDLPAAIPESGEKPGLDVYETVKAWQVPLWDAINAYMTACGGHQASGAVPRMKAVAEFNRTLEGLLAGLGARA